MKLVFLMSACALFLVGCAEAHDAYTASLAATTAYNRCAYESAELGVEAREHCGPAPLQTYQPVTQRPQATRRLSDDPCQQAYFAALGGPTQSGSPGAEGLANAKRAELVCRGYAVPPPPPAPPVIVAPLYPQQTICQPFGFSVICNSQ